MDFTQVVITVLALLGIALMGLMAVVPTVLELRDPAARRPPRPVPLSRPAERREDHDLAA